VSDDDRLDARVTELEGKQSSMDGKLDELLALIKGDKDKVHDKSTEVVESRLDRGTSIQEQVRAELARAEQEQASSKAAQDEKESLHARLAKLEETHPEPPQPRRQKVMWGSR